MTEPTNAASAGVQRNPDSEMDPCSPEWEWYPEVLDRFGPIEEWTDEDWEDADHLQSYEWRRRHPRSEGKPVPWEEAKLVLAERLAGIDDPEAQALVREWFPEGLPTGNSGSKAIAD